MPQADNDFGLESAAKKFQMSANNHNASSETHEEETSDHRDCDSN